MLLRPGLLVLLAVGLTVTAMPGTAVAPVGGHRPAPVRAPQAGCEQTGRKGHNHSSERTVVPHLRTRFPAPGSRCAVAS